MKNFSFFAVIILAVAAMSVNAQELTPRKPVVPWGAQAEIIITNDLTEKYDDSSWHLTADAQKWIEYNYDGTTAGGTVQTSNRNNVWFDFYSEAAGCDDMIVTSAELNWGGYLSVTNKDGLKDGLFVVGKNRYPTFYVTGIDKAKFYFSGAAGTKGYPQIEVYEVGNETPIASYIGDYGLTKSTWDYSTLLIASGLDKGKSYKIVARTLALVDEIYTYDGGDIMLQVVMFYGDQAPMREDGLIVSGSEIGSYINAHLAAYPEVTDFILEAGGRYTITEGITAPGKFTLTGVSSAPATIDASALAAPFVQFATIAEDAEKNEYGFVAATNVKFANVKVNALGQTLFSSNKQRYVIPELAVDNCVVELTGNPLVFDFRSGGVVAELSVNKSTIYASTATSSSFYSSSSGNKATEAGLEEQVFSITNSTLSNIAVDKNFCAHRMSGTTWLTYEVQNSIIANCGKDNFMVSINGGQASASPNYIFESITVLKTESDALTNINDQQIIGDEQEKIVNPIGGVPFTLENALAGNFKLIASSQQAKYMTGDPRWLTPYATDAILIEVDQYENTDFAAVLNESLKISEQPSNIIIQFYEAGEYPLTQPINTNSPITIKNGSDIYAGEATIVVNNGMTLGGAIKIDGVNLKAGDELTEPIITLQGNPYRLQENGFYDLGKIQLLNLTVSNLKGDLIYGNKVRNLISEIETKNCQIYMAAEKKTIFDFTGGGVVGKLSVLNSTLDAAGSYIYSSQSGHKATEAGLTQQTFSITNSTIYRTAAKVFLHRQSGQSWLRYILKNSMVINPADDNFVAGLNGGVLTANPTWEITDNAFQKVEGGVATDLAESQVNGDNEEPVENSVLGTMAFTNLEAPDFGGTFTLATGQDTPTSLGDPRWSISFINDVVAPVTPPAGLKTTTCYLTCNTYNSGKIRGRELQVGIAGTEVYVQGLCGYLPEAWVKGTVDVEAQTATFASGQFFGSYVYDEENTYDMYFVGYDNNVNDIADVVCSFNMVDMILTTDYYIYLNDNPSTLNWFDFYHRIFISTEVPEVPETIVVPEDLVTEAYAFKGYDNHSGQDNYSEVQIGFYDENKVYIQGLSADNLPDAWVVGTLEGTALTIPETYLGLCYVWAGEQDVYFSGATFVYDPVAETFTSAAGYVSYETPSDLEWVDDYNKVVLTKVYDIAATPADPEVTYLQFTDTDYPYVNFNIPAVDTDGNPMMLSKLFYTVWYEEGGTEKKFVVLTDDYVYVSSDMEEIPYIYNDFYDIYRGGETFYLNPADFDYMTWTKMGVQSIYYGGGERHESNIIWVDPVGIKELTPDSSSKRGEEDVIYNLAGQRIGKSQMKAGIYIINGRKVVVK